MVAALIVCYKNIGIIYTTRRSTRLNLVSEQKKLGILHKLNIETKLLMKCTNNKMHFLGILCIISGNNSFWFVQIYVPKNRESMSNKMFNNLF